MEASKRAASMALFMGVCLISASAPEYDRIAGKCTQQTRQTTFYLDCSAQQMRHTIAEWPEDALQHNVTRIVAYFNHNDMERVATLPAADVDLLLSYARNRISALEDAIFANCANVSSLDLSYNQLRSDALITNVFRGPYSDRKYAPIALRALNLAHNSLHTLGKSAFEHLASLTWLDLSANRFRIIDQLTALSFEKLPNLEHLSLAHNRLTHLNRSTFACLRRLRTLDIAGNGFVLLPDAIKDVAATLTTLRVGSNPIREIAEEHLAGMDTLVELSATNLSQIEAVHEHAFRSLRHLRKVDVSMIGRHVAIADDLFSASVRELNLSYASIEKLSPRLVNWSQLTDLDLRGNPLYCTCDLHSIATQLQDAMKRDDDGPFCFDEKRSKQLEMRALNAEICFESEEYASDAGSVPTSERVIRMTLLAASIILIVCLCVAGWVGYVRCYGQRSYPFSAAVVYNPLPPGGA